MDEPEVEAMDCDASGIPQEAQSALIACKCHVWTTDDLPRGETAHHTAA